MIEKKEILEEMNNRSREVFRRVVEGYLTCLLYTSDAADEGLGVDLGGRRII